MSNSLTEEEDEEDGAVDFFRTIDIVVCTQILDNAVVQFGRSIFCFPSMCSYPAVIARRLSFFRGRSEDLFNLNTRFDVIPFRICIIARII